MMFRFISSKGVLRPQGRSAQSAIRSHELGASLVEYALLVALIAVVAIVAVRSVGTSTSKQAIIAGCRIDTSDNPNEFVQCCVDQGLDSGDCDGPVSEDGAGRPEGGGDGGIVPL